MTAPTLTLVRPPVVSTHAGIDAALATAGREVLRLGVPLRAVDHDNLRRGVRYRVLLAEDVRANPVLSLRLSRLTLTGAEVRTVSGLPAEATVVDGRLAMLPAAGGSELAVVRLPSVVCALVALFEQLWLAAAPLTSAEVTNGAGLTARERELLGLLSAGCTDESAAARLGISVRTVRRMMAAIMTRLGARSRFQAGLKAADRGLLARPA
jgi:DNA-binding CsgD family transcriptional regulator